MKKNNNDVFKVLMLWAMSGLVYAEDDLLQFNSISNPPASQAKTHKTSKERVSTAQVRETAVDKSQESSAKTHRSPSRKSSTHSAENRSANKSNSRSEANWVPRKRVKSHSDAPVQASHRAINLQSSSTTTRNEQTASAASTVTTSAATSNNTANENWIPRKRRATSSSETKSATNAADSKARMTGSQQASQSSSSATSLPAQQTKVAQEPALNSTTSPATAGAPVTKATGSQQASQSISAATSLPAQQAKVVQEPTLNSTTSPATAGVPVTKATGSQQASQSSSATTSRPNQQAKVVEQSTAAMQQSVALSAPAHANEEPSASKPAEHQKKAAISSENLKAQPAAISERPASDKAQSNTVNTTRTTSTEKQPTNTAAKPTVTNPILSRATVEPTPVATPQAYSVTAVKTLQSEPIKSQANVEQANLPTTAWSHANNATASQANKSSYSQQHRSAAAQVTKPQPNNATAVAQLKSESTALATSDVSHKKLASTDQLSRTLGKTSLSKTSNPRSVATSKKPISSINAGEKLNKAVIVAAPETLGAANPAAESDLKALLANNATDSKNAGAEQITVSKYSTNTRGFLRQVIQEAMNYSPEIKGQQANSIAAGYDAEQVKGQRWPQISVGAATPMKSVGSGNRNASSRLSDSFATVNATTNIYDFGQTSAKVDAAENAQKSSTFTLTMTRNQIAGQLLKQILQLRQYQEQLAVAKTFHARMSKLTDMMSQIVDKDPGRGSELVQARAKLLEADTNIRNTENSLENTQIAIMRLIGHRLTLPVGLDFSHIDMTKNQIDAALKVHPKLLADKEDYDAAKNRTKAADAEKYPRINWVVSKSTEKDEDGHQDAWQTGVQLQWDLFSGGSTVASVKAAASRASASKMQLDTDRLEIENQVENLLFQKSSSQVRSQDYQKLIKETDKVSQMFYEQWYYLGKRSLLDVLTSETDHFNQQLSEIQIRYEGYQASTGLLVQTVNLLPWAGLSL